MRRVGPGSPEPLGVTLVQGGANVAVYSAHAAAITVKLLTALRSLDPYADGIDVARH